MKVYLVEVVIGKNLESISIQTDFEIARGFIGDRVGIITEMIL